MTAIYLACVVGGVLLLRFREEIAGWPPKDDPWTILVYGVVLLVVGAVCLAACVAGFFLPRRPWAWIAHLVLISIGLTSCCTIPASVPLLVAWLKPDLRAWFGR
jgi:MFS family permease